MMSEDPHLSHRSASDDAEPEEELIDAPPPHTEAPSMLASEDRTPSLLSNVVEMRTVRLSDASGRYGIFTGTAASSSHLPIEGVIVYESDPVCAKFAGRWDSSSGVWSQGQLTYRSGDVYTGTFDDCGRPSGPHGHYTFAEDGRVYRGDFFEGRRHGRGVLTWPDGSIYQGAFVRNVREGQAIYHAPGGIVYHGSFQRGVYHGYGEYQASDQSVYRGSFEDGKPHGHGVLVNKNGDVVHDGEWDHGQPVSPNGSDASTATTATKSAKANYKNSQSKASQPKVEVVHNREWVGHRGRALYRGLWDVEKDGPVGHGTVEYDDQTVYEGCLDEDGQWHGTGRWSSSNGDGYEGNFVHGERHGYGIYTWSDGRQYQGSFEHNLRQGKGVLVYPNQDLYEGEFKQGQRHGHGSFTFANGAVYDGEWEAGFYSGRGKLVQNNGKTYEGQFQNGVAHGRGCEWDAKGKVLHEGWWSRGRPATEQEVEASKGAKDKLENDATAESHSTLCFESMSLAAESPILVQQDGIPPRPLSPVGPPPAAAPPPPPPSSEQLPLSPPLSAPKSSAMASISPVLERPRPRDLEKCKAVVDQPLSDAQGNTGRYTGIVVLVPHKNSEDTSQNEESNGQSTSPMIMKPHGVGRMVYADGKRIHEGFWKCGNKEGHGRCLFFPQGDWHEGEYVDNMRHGPGRYHWKDGRLFEGNYENDYRHGEGIFTYPTKEVYRGDFVKGQRWGYGRFEFADGAGYYEGEWRAGKYHGKGKLYVRKPITESLVSSDPTKNFLLFEGDFVAGVFHGFGTKTDLSTGEVESGEWVKGQLLVAPSQESTSTAAPIDSVGQTDGSAMVLPPDDSSEHLDTDPAPSEDCLQGSSKDPDAAAESIALTETHLGSNSAIEVD